MQKYKGRAVILPIVLIILSIIIVSVSTFALLRTHLNSDGNVQFDKVQLSANTNVGTSKELGLLMPGESIINDRVAVSKDVSSTSIYIRAKLSFYTTATDVPEMVELVEKLRTSTAIEFNISTTEIGNTGAKWSEKIGNYFYLITSDGLDNQLFKVVDATEFKLSDKLIIPMGVVDGDFDSKNDDYVYDEYPIYVSFAFEAIQSQGVSDNLNTAKEVFNTIFPANNNEFIDDEFTVDFNVNGGNSVQPIEVSNGLVRLPDEEDLGVRQVNYSLNGVSTPSEVTLLNWQDNKGNLYEPGDIVAITKDSSFNAVWPTSGVAYTLTDLSNAYNPFPKPSKAAYVAQNQNLTGVVYIPSVFRANSVTYKVEGIGSNAFKNLPVTEVHVDGEIESVGDSAFEGCTQLKNFVYLGTITDIGDRAFYGCENLGEVDISGVQDLGQNAFAGSGMTTVIIDEGVKVVEDGAFEDCAKLVKVVIPSTVHTISANAFSGCASLKNIVLHDEIYSIEENAFSDTAFFNTSNNWVNGGLYNVTESGKKYLIAINSSYSGAFSVASNTILIADKAGYDCTDLTSINIPDTVKVVGKDALTNTGFFNNQSNWATVSNAKCLYSTNSSGNKQLIKVTSNSAITLTVDTKTILIAEECFKDVSAITRLTLPNTVKYIDENIFPATVDTVDMSAFSTQLQYFGSQTVASNFKILLSYTTQASLGSGTAVYDTILANNTSNALGYVWNERVVNTYTKPDVTSTMNIKDSSTTLWTQSWHLSGSAIDKTTQGAVILFQANPKATYDFEYIQVEDSDASVSRLVASLELTVMDNYSTGVNTSLLYKNEGTNKYNKNTIRIKKSEQTPANT